MRTFLTAIAVLVATLLSILGCYFASGFTTPLEALRRTFEERLWFVDGWPMLVEALVLGPTCVGPIIVWLHRSALFRRPVFSGANLWSAMGIASIPLLSVFLLCAFASRAPIIPVVGFALWILAILTRATAVSALTLAVLFRSTMFRGDAERSTLVDVCGICLGAVWSCVALYQVWSLVFLGLPK